MPPEIETSFRDPISGALAHQVHAGAAVITWSVGYPFPIAVNHKRLNGKVWLVTLCPITYRLGRHTLLIPVGYEFDGASIPRLFWMIPGFAPLGAHLWGALIHDFCCDNPAEVPRPIGDAIFGLMLVAAKVPTWKAWCMRAAVRGYSLLREIRGVR